MSLWSSVAEVLPILEPHVKEVEVCGSLTEAAARPAELSQQHPHWAVLFYLFRGDALACGRASRLRSELRNPQVKHSQRLVRRVSTPMTDPASRLHPCETSCRHCAPL